MQSGYAITIRAFLPVDPKDIRTHHEALEAIKAAQSGEASSPFDAMMALATVEEFTVKPVQRRAKEAST